MTDVRLTDLPSASAVADTDILIIDDGAATKKAVASLVRAVGTKTQAWNALLDWVSDNLSSVGQALIAADDAAAQRAALELGSAALKTAGTLSGQVLLLAADNKLPALNAELLTNLPPVSVPTVRNTAQAGVTDGNGRAAFITAGSGLRPGLLATASPLVLTFAHGVADYSESLAADSATFFPAVTANNTSILTATRVGAGNITGGSTLLPLVISYTAPTSPATGQDWFDQSTNLMKSWNGSAWVVVDRVHLGECVAGSSTITSVVSYAFGGAFTSSEYATANGVTSIVHNIGVVPKSHKAVLVCKTTEQGYSVGDEIPISDVPRSSDLGRPFSCVVDRLNCTIIRNTNAGVFNKSSSALAALTDANWRVKLYADRR